MHLYENGFIISKWNISLQLDTVKPLKALILAGGFGTRLRPLSCTRPKILFPIVNRPLLQWILERLAKNGIKEVMLAVNLQTEVFIKEHEVPQCGLHLSFSRDPVKKPLGTGGAIKRAEKRIGHEEDFLVLNGDIFADIDYSKISKVHRKRNATATIALCKVDDPSRYGVAQVTEKGRIERFIEKPPANAAPSKLVNAGIYALSPEIFAYIKKDRKVSLEREVFPKLSEEGTLYGHVFQGLWKDLGKLEDYLETNKIVLDATANQPKRKMEYNFEVQKPVAFHQEVSIGDNSVIGPYVVLGRNVVIGKEVHIENSVILPGTSISDYSSIHGALIGENVVIGEKVKIGERCVLGDYVRVENNVSLARGISVCPAKQVSESVLTPTTII